MKHMRTSDLARVVGVHPNTVRRYAAQGLLPPVPRGANGYRRFTREHLDCLRIVRMIYSTNFPVKAVRLAGSQIIRRAATGDWAGALEQAHAYLALVQAERAHADAAATLLERWATGTAADDPALPLRIGNVARVLGMSIDVLRNWERSGLITVPRNARNGYRLYGSADLSRLRVIRMLNRAGYSQMAILRMLLQLDRGVTTDLRHSLGAPAPDDDVRTAADRWLSSLAEQEAVALRLVVAVAEIIDTSTSREPSAG